MKKKWDTGSLLVGYIIGVIVAYVVTWFVILKGLYEQGIITL